jgi:hypothetical protein
VQSQKDRIGLNEKNDIAAKKIQISKKTASNKIRGVSVKKTLDVNLDDPIIKMQSTGQYFKNFGIISADRTNLYNRNEEYLNIQELSFNLDFIASSIMGGEIDRLILRSESSSLEEKVLYIKHDGNLYFLYGIFPDKQGYWFLQEMVKALREAQIGTNKEMSEYEKIELENLKRKLSSRMNNILKEYIKMGEVFTPKEIPMVDEDLRVDYFGMSFKSTGLISNIFGEELDFKLDFEVAEEMKDDIKESVITSKIEAIAAFTTANTQVIPLYLSVKLSFQKYRFLLFERMKNVDYYLYVLAEGNLKKYPTIRNQLVEIVEPFTINDFKGDLNPFLPLKESISGFFQMRIF